MKFKPWQETFSSSRSLFKVLPSFFLSPTRSKTVIAEWVWHSENAASGSFCSSGSVLYCTCKLLRAGAQRELQAPTPPKLVRLQREERPPQQLRHTKKRAWPFLFNLRIFPRRCLAVAIPFFGRLPFVAWLLIGGGLDAGLFVGWRGTEKEVSPTGLSGLTLPLFIWHTPEIKLEFCVYFPFCGLEPLLDRKSVV